MFKKLLTTMLVVAVVAMAGTALAGDAEYKFYGKLHSSINMLGNGENSQLGLTSNTSRFGFKGWKPMNDDWSMIWQFESSLNIAQRTGTTLARRNTFIGFKNADLGQVRMGIHDTPFKTLGRKVTFFKDTIGDHRSTTMGWDRRLGDILAWVSPDWDGFGLFVAYQFDQDGTKLTSDNPDAEFKALTAFSGMAHYTQDQFFLGVAMEKLSEGYAASYNNGTDMVYGDAPMGIRFAGKYKGDQFMLSGLYQSLSGQVLNGTADGFVDMNASTIGFEGLFMANEQYNVKAGYYMADPNTDVDDDDYSLMTFGVDRVFTKNVTVYVQYAALSYGDAAGNPALNGGGAFGGSVDGFMNVDTTTTPATVTYENPYGFSVGAVVTW